jgi:hypothetical protein
MLRKNKMPLVSAGLEKSPVLAVTASAVIWKNLEDVPIGEAQRKAADCINDHGLYPRWRTLKLSVEKLSATVETALACGIPVVRLIAASFVKAIATRNEYRGRTRDAPRTLNVQRPLANSPSPASAVW